MMLMIYVPLPETTPDRLIRAGSGIVGQVTEPGATHQLIFYEGNLYDAENLRTYAERLAAAAGRALINAETRARLIVPTAEVLAIGVYSTDRWEMAAGFDYWSEQLRAWINRHANDEPASAGQLIII